MTTAIICTAILAALLLVLGLNVSRMRGVTGKTGGSQFPNDPASPLLKAIRPTATPPNTCPRSSCSSSWSAPAARPASRSR